MTTLKCPKCGRIQEIASDIYFEMKRARDAFGNRHPLTCTCGDHIEMIQIKPRIDRCPEGPCPACGTPVKNATDQLDNGTDKELYALECPKCGWETVIEFEG